MNDELIESILRSVSESRLREELKRRTDERKAERGQILRCRDCIHCFQGYTSKFAASCGNKTSVCEMRPKDKVARYCFYATTHSNKACDKFEPKIKTE